MTAQDDKPAFSDQLAMQLPYLRRYARALTGTQAAGDRYTVATLEAILQDRSGFANDYGIKVNLFAGFHAIWQADGRALDLPDDASQERVQRLLSALTENAREALLLHRIEGFTPAQIGHILGQSAAKVTTLLAIALTELGERVTGRVMIIEDEPIIAADLASMMGDLGHQVTGIARTHHEALALGAKSPADLILADIQLADNSSGIDAVNDLLEQAVVPIIFITAFPERLLTGDKPEPAFLISKPFQEEQVKSAVSHAMFFASTAMLNGPA